MIRPLFSKRPTSNPLFDEAERELRGAIDGDTSVLSNRLAVQIVLRNKMMGVCRDLFGQPSMDVQDINWNNAVYDWAHCKAAMPCLESEVASKVAEILSNAGEDISIETLRDLEAAFESVTPELQSKDYIRASIDAVREAGGDDLDIMAATDEFMVGTKLRLQNWILEGVQNDVPILPPAAANMLVDVSNAYLRVAEKMLQDVLDDDESSCEEKVVAIEKAIEVAKAELETYVLSDRVHAYPSFMDALLRAARSVGDQWTKNQVPNPGCFKKVFYSDGGDLARRLNVVYEILDYMKPAESVEDRIRYVEMVYGPQKENKEIWPKE